MNSSLTVLAPEQDDLLEVLAEIVTRLMMGDERLDARTTTEREPRPSRGTHLRAQVRRQA